MYSNDLNLRNGSCLDRNLIFETNVKDMENTEKTEKETLREIPVKTEKIKMPEEAEETAKTGARGQAYARRAARLLLLQMGAGENCLPVDPLQAMQCLCREQGGVICLKWSEAKQAFRVPDPFHLRQRGLDARTVMDAEGSFITVWDDERGTPARRRFTLAHEAGHIALGHFEDAAAREIMSRAPVDAKTRARRAEMEREADAFAAELLCPGVLLRQVFYDCDAATVSAAFDISMQCAEARLKAARENAGEKSEEDGKGDGCSCADEKRRAGEACRANGKNTALDGAASLWHSRREADARSHNSEKPGAEEAADDGYRMYGAASSPDDTLPLWHSPEMPRPVCMGDAIDTTERALLHRMTDVAAEMPVNGPRCVKCGTAVTRPDQRYCAGCGAPVDLPGTTLHGPGSPAGHLTPRDFRYGAYCLRCGWAPEKAEKKERVRGKNAPGSGITFPGLQYITRNSAVRQGESSNAAAHSVSFPWSGLFARNGERKPRNGNSTAETSAEEHITGGEPGLMPLKNGRLRAGTDGISSPRVGESFIRSLYHAGETVPSRQFGASCREDHTLPRETRGKPSLSPETAPSRRCCPECGAPLWNRCLRCGRVWPDGVNHCPDCGMICALGEINRENAGQNRLLQRLFPAAGTFLPEPRLQYARGEALRLGRVPLAAALRAARLLVNDENGLLLAVLTTRDRKTALRHNCTLLDMLDEPFSGLRHPFIGIYARDEDPPVEEIFGLPRQQEAPRVKAPSRAAVCPGTPPNIIPFRPAARTGSSARPG